MRKTPGDSSPLTVGRAVRPCTNIEAPLGSATFPAALHSTALTVLRTVKVLPYKLRLSLSGSQDR